MESPLRRLLQVPRPAAVSQSSRQPFVYHLITSSSSLGILPCLHVREGQPEWFSGGVSSCCSAPNLKDVSISHLQHKSHFFPSVSPDGAGFTLKECFAPPNPRWSGWQASGEEVLGTVTPQSETLFWSTDRPNGANTVSVEMKHTETCGRQENEHLLHSHHHIVLLAFRYTHTHTDTDTDTR